jgi:predicted ribosome quality control (RQC) complex YloA/Tae2 family protein
MFKEEVVKIRFEFTGRYTNVIILDEDDTIIEALRHISENRSSRVVMPGLKLKELDPVEIKEKVFEIDDIERYTQELFNKKYQQRLNQKKSAIIGRIDKKIKDIEKKLNALQDETKLLEKSELYKKYADVAMANLYQIKPYMKELKTYDFEGNEITIPLPELKNVNEIGNHYYNLSKKAKRKAQNLHIERDYLNSQLEFLKNYKDLIQTTDNLGSLNYYKPPKKEKVQDENIAEFFIDDYKVLVGKNEKGNVKLLKNSNANDLWLHIKDVPGAHVIIKNSKLSVPQQVIDEAARLAVAFSKKNEGLVDYTKRKFVKVKEGANVEYGKYSTVKVKL